MQTQRQKMVDLMKLLEEIRDFIVTEGSAPSYREISAGVDISLGKIHRMINSLEKQGFIKKKVGKRRSLELTAKASSALSKT